VHRSPNVNDGGESLLVVRPSPWGRPKPQAVALRERCSSVKGNLRHVLLGESETRDKSGSTGILAEPLRLGRRPTLTVKQWELAAVRDPE